MKLLVIDDDNRFTRSLYYLFSKSYTVHIAPHAQNALEKLQNNKYNLIILDLGLPDMHGSKVYRQIRQIDTEVPVVVLSGQTNIDKKITLLHDGISDYLTKPIHAEELEARVRLQLQGRKSSIPRRHLTVGDLVVDTFSRMAFRSGRPIFLRAKEYALLECLLLNVNQKVRTELLIDYIWDGEQASANALQAQVTNLRRKVESSSTEKMIHTVHAYGYSLVEPSMELHDA